MAGRPRQATTPEDPETPEQNAALVRAAIHIFDPEFDSQTLAGKIAHISGMLTNIPKNGRNQAQGYRFVQESDLVAAIRPYLAAAGIVIIPTVTAHELIDLGQTRGGSTNRLTILTIDYRITDGKEVINGTVVGYGADTGDKGVYKAMTGGLKYVLMKVFQVDTGDDPERDAEHDKAPVVRAATRPSTPRGGHQVQATETQFASLTTLIREKQLNFEATKALLARNGIIVPELPEDGRAEAFKTFILGLTSDQLGAVINTLDTGEVSEPDGGGYG